jgi:histone H3/H4
MADLVVQSTVKDQFEDMNVSAEFYDALDQEVDALLEKAARRAQDNERKTVQPRDL